MVGRVMTKSLAGCFIIGCFLSCLILWSDINHQEDVGWRRLLNKRKPLITIDGEYHASVQLSDVPLSGSEDSTMGRKQTSSEVQRRRRHKLHRRCQQYTNTGKNFTSHGTRNFVVDHNYRFLYCPVAKAAEANWKRVILVLSDKAKTTDELQHFEVLGKDNELYQTINMTKRHRFTDYKRFLFVRHPFKRLLSAYRNKFELPDEWGVKYQRNFGRKIIKQYRENASNHSLQNGDDVTFSEFVQYILDRADAPELFNMHWRPQYLTCDVCNQHFDVIGKFESIQEDARYVLTLINASHRVRFPELERSASHVTNSSRDDVYCSYFSQISSENIEKLYKLYEPDFKLFGYDFSLDLLRTTNTATC